MDGILVINKEKGWTSADVVAKLRHVLHMKKIGHTGTLDPAATGVLPVALGNATGLTEFLTEKKKTYHAVLRLGVTTDTQDMTGTVISEQEVQVTEVQLREALASFLGEQLQLPPMYSAVKQGGKRLYELARKGITVERKERPVTFYELQVLSWENPVASLLVACSKGTYIRTLCNDLGEKLGCGGCMQELIRTASGSFTLEDSHTISEVSAAMEENRAQALVIPTDEILGDYPGTICIPEADRLLQNGNPLTEEQLQQAGSSAGESGQAGITLAQLPGDGKLRGRIRVYQSDGKFTGLYEWSAKRRFYRPVKMFL
ncbi:MAG: tRNA pseudouridine(55) synthase TruB [Blautia sp.]|nr:tRNA pseudouridine(55) synthase TruB [Blautia sp.]